MDPKIILSSCIVVIFLTYINADDRTLKLVHVRGMKMQYNLGEFLRKQYIEKDMLLKPAYDRSEVYIRSSTTDRCLVSALSQLAGIYPPHGHQVWNKDINWQPIPIHSVPTAEDTFFEMDAVSCPNLKKAVDEWHETKEYIKVNTENKDFFRRLSNLSGSEITSVDNVWRLADTLFTEKVHNLTIPSWVPGIWDRLKSIYNWGFVHKFAGSTRRSSLNAGPLLNDVLSHMKDMANGELSDLKKMYLYSGHDTNVLPFLAAINVFTHQPPPYAAAGIVEFYEDKNKEFTVDVLYRNDSTQFPYKLPVKGCGTPCKFKDFLKIVESRAISDVAEACGTKESSFEYVWRHHTLLFICVAVLSGLLILIVTICLVRVARRKSLQHLRRWDFTDIDKASDSQYLVH